MTKTLMYYGNDPNQEQMVYIVWKLVGDRPVISVICTNDEVLARYVSSDRTRLINSETPVFVEKAITDHLYGANDMAIAAKLLRKAL